MPVESNSVAWSCDCFAHRFGNAGDRPERVRLCGSDMTDAEWAIVRDALPVPSWLEGRGGQPEGYCHQQMLDAVRCLVDNGIKWRAMPADFPAWDRVYAFARRWRAGGPVGGSPSARNDKSPRDSFEFPWGFELCPRGDLNPHAR
ncbi:transposase [Kitasatospora sp. NPDC101155]|uniref:transposase n=1 Tax=Kitasatospora sp. NPDC101155 TaxID=3364097 RepID=UPI003817A7F2